MDSQPEESCAAPAPVGESPGPGGPMPVTTPCWRCGKPLEFGASECPWCRAVPVATASHPPLPRQRATLESLAGYYSILLLSSVAFGLAGRAAEGPGDDGAIGEDMGLTLTLECVWTLGVLVALARMPAPPPLRRDAGARLAGWALSLPILLLMLTVNYAYHAALGRYLGIEPEGRFAIKDSDPGRLLLAVGVVCLQPAIVEELFFRRLALGTLRCEMGDHSALVVSSIMFGAAHLGVPLSVPILSLVGLGLGYIRIKSGSLLAPMLMHALHNGVVLWTENWP